LIFVDVFRGSTLRSIARFVRCPVPPLGGVENPMSGFSCQATAKTATSIAIKLGELRDLTEYHLTLPTGCRYHFRFRRYDPSKVTFFGFFVILTNFKRPYLGILNSNGDRTKCNRRVCPRSKTAWYNTSPCQFRIPSYGRWRAPPSKKSRKTSKLATSHPSYLGNGRR
jgi:hypothetical protein